MPGGYLYGKPRMDLGWEAQMGLWDWIVGALTQERNPREGPAGLGGRRQDRSHGSGATATMAPPLEPSPESEPQPGERWWSREDAALTEPVEVCRPQLPAAALALENLLISHFDGHDLSLPPLLHVADRALRQLRDPKSSLTRVAEEIAEDQVMAAAVLRMANSPLYCGLHKSTTLPAAVTRLGVRALRTLMMHQSLQAITFHGKHEGAHLAELLWTRSLASASIMRSLARFTSLEEEDASLIGLLHDIGNVVVLRVVLDSKAVMRYDLDLDTFEYLCHECHQEFGELIANEWKLPSDVKALVADHHSHPDPDDPLRIERLQLRLSDMLTAMLGYAPPALYDLLNARVVRELGLSEREDFLSWLDTLPEEVEEATKPL